MAELDASVVIPARNAASVLPIQLAALAAQDFRGEWEVVVVDDASTDGTAAIAERAGHDFARLRVVRSSAQTNAGGARNLGASTADGRLLAFCDADDKVSPSWLSGLVEASRSHAAVVGPLEYRALNPERVAARWGQTYTNEPMRIGPWILAPGGCCAVRREVFEAVGGFDQTLRRGEDAELFIRIQRAGESVGYAPDSRVSVRLRAPIRQNFRNGVSFAEVIDPLLPRIEQPTYSAARAGRRLAASPSAQTLGLLVTDAAFLAGRQLGRLRRTLHRTERS